MTEPILRRRTTDHANDRFDELTLIQEAIHTRLDTMASNAKERMDRVEGDVRDVRTELREIKDELHVGNGDSIMTKIIVLQQTVKQLVRWVSWFGGIAAVLVAALIIAFVTELVGMRDKVRQYETLIPPATLQDMLKQQKEHKK